MTVLFRSDAGPLEGFTRATFRVAINDDGVGELTATADVIDGISGPIECAVDGVTVFRWTPEERRVESRDTELVTLSGRGRAAALERAIVLPVGYPAFTSRTRTETGAPLAVFSVLLAEAQARGRVTDLSPTWTDTEDSKGAPWTETVSVQFAPGNDLRAILSNLTEVEGAEWIVRANGDIDVAPQLGDDRSSEVVLFYGYDQVSRSRRSSDRDRRQTVFIEASTGVSESVNSADVDAGEIWLEAQDYADPVSRQTLADKVALKLSLADEEVNVRVAADVGAFTRFGPGDIVSVDSGAGPFEQVRVVGLAVDVTPDRERFEATLVSEVTLYQQKIERAIETQADVRLAASPSIQRRHGLVTADKFLSGAVGADVAISSENFVPGVDGWAILGNGNAEFNDAVFRGDLESVNYDPGVDGWRLGLNGFAELNDAIFRGDLESSNFVTGTSGWQLTNAGDFEVSGGIFRGTVEASVIQGSQFIAPPVSISSSGISIGPGTGVGNAIRWLDPNAGTEQGRIFGTDLNGINVTSQIGLQLFTASNAPVGNINISPREGFGNTNMLGTTNINQLVTTFSSTFNGTAQFNSSVNMSGATTINTLTTGNTFLNNFATFELGFNSLIFARDSNTNPAVQTPRAILNWSTPRITVISQNAAPAVFGRNSNGTVVNFRRSGASRGTIVVTTVGTSYNTTSDERIKTEISDATDSINVLSRIRPVTHRWLNEPDGDSVYGVIAHELQEVIPYAVFGERNAVDEDGEPLLQQVDYSKLVPLLIGAVQELADRVDNIKQGE